VANGYNNRNNLYSRSVTVPSRRRSRALSVNGATADELKSKIVALKTVIVSGVESAAYGDKKTEFRSLEELREILAGLEEELEDLLGLGGRVRQFRMTTQSDKGL